MVTPLQSMENAFETDGGIEEDRVVKLAPHINEEIAP